MFKEERLEKILEIIEKNKFSIKNIFSKGKRQ